MNKTKTIAGTLLLAAALLVPPAARAAAAAPKPSQTDVVSWYFNRPAGEIAALRTEGFGYGEIVKIFVIAEMSRKATPDLLAENRKGYGWGALSVKLGLNPVFVKLRVDSARRDLNIRVRPAKRGKEERVP